MQNRTIFLLLTSILWLVSCNSDDDSMDIESIPEMSGTANQEQEQEQEPEPEQESEPDAIEVVDAEQMPISTASLVDSGVNNEIPVLVERTSFSFGDDVISALSPDGSELAFVLDLDGTVSVSILSTETQALLREFSLDGIAQGLSLIHI